MQSEIPGGLSIEQNALTFKAPTIPGKTAVTTNRAMTRNQNRQRIRAARAPDRPNRFRRSDPIGNIRIACRRARRDLPQCLPDAPLERSTLNVDWELMPRRLSFDEGNHLRNDSIERGIFAGQTSAREPCFRIARQSVRIVAQHDCADAPVARCDENDAQRTVAHGKADVRMRAIQRFSPLHILKNTKKRHRLCLY